QQLREVVSSELTEVAEKFATPRRTVLLESGGAQLTAAVPLEVADDPCVVLLSSAGLLARATITNSARPEADAAGQHGASQRSAHDVIVSAVPTTARGTIGVVTSAGRLIKMGVLELPALPPSAHSPGLAGGAPLSEFVALPAGESVIGLASIETAGAGLALGTASGVVKRVTPDYPQTQSEFDVIALRDDDRVVGAVQLSSEDQDLVFITSDAQLLRFGADNVRPQGRSAGGMAGIRLSRGASAIWFGAVTPADGDDDGAPVVVTVAGTTGALPGTAAGTVKVTPYVEYPPKGRATGGVRCQRFLRGEDTLVLAWAGHSPALGATEAGTPVELPEVDERRDGSGTHVAQPLAAVGGTAAL
ncbi:MAG: DNA gyrase C-terminal beta-propeller domain-containing protein, partial [Streptosporangiaceae bacterium]